MTQNILQKIFKPSERGMVRRFLFIIIALVIICAVIDSPAYYNKAVDFIAQKTNNKVRIATTTEKTFSLGLDLQGGSHLVYSADMSEIDDKDRYSALEGVRDVIERRVNVFGVSEPIVQTNVAGGEYRIIVELAGIKDVEEAIKMIGETPLLEFKEQVDQIRELTPEEQTYLEEFNTKAEEKRKAVEAGIKEGKAFEDLAKEYSDDTQTKDNGGDVGWINSENNAQLVELAQDLEVGEISTVNVFPNAYQYVKLEDKKKKVNPFNDNEVEKEVKASHILICHQESEGCGSELTKDEALQKVKDLETEVTPQNFAEMASENSDGPSASDGGNLGWFGRSAMVAPFADTVFDNQEVGTISYIVETKFGYHLIYKQNERDVEEYQVKHIIISRLSEQDIIGDQKEFVLTELTGKHLERATVQRDPNDNSIQVALLFDGEGKDLFADITERNVGKPVGIFLDGYAISVPTVNEKIANGSAVISGNFSIAEGKLLAQRLNAGALPVPIEIISQQTVGASLGKMSLTASLKAGIIGLILVAIFMILYYRLPGLIAVLSLISYSIIVLAIFKTVPAFIALIVVLMMIWLMLITFKEIDTVGLFLACILFISGVILFYYASVPVVLTLSGLAGFILSIGMAVDANVLIFERLKEELADGNPIGIAINNSFKRAWPSIRDGNISTVITCLILSIFSTSIIKGFAITLMIGVIASMFSAIVITRTLMQCSSGKWLEKNKWLIGYKK